MKNRFLLYAILFFLMSTAIVLILCFAFGVFDTNGMPPDSTQTNTAPTRYTTVIIDAGHGGEDGGASSAAGLVEKDVNLEISKMIADMLRAGGVNVVMTREDDRLLYDRNVDYQGRKKKLDLAARLTVAQNTPDSIFVSIHMNSFTSPKYSGLQVWYSPNNPDSMALAEIIRAFNKDMLQNNNTRKTKEATDSIFLLDKATCPAVLIECGFLSNADEAARFESTEYKRQVAFVIFCSIVEFLSGEN